VFDHLVDWIVIEISRVDDAIKSVLRKVGYVFNATGCQRLYGLEDWS